MAIRYATRPAVRNADTVARLRDMAEGEQLGPAVAIDRAAVRIVDEMTRIHGGEWDDDIPPNIAPVLGAFVRGKYGTRRYPWQPLPGSGMRL